MALLAINALGPQIQLLYTNVVKPECRVKCVLQFQAQLLVTLSSDQLQRFLGGEQNRNKEFRFRLWHCRYRNSGRKKAGKFVTL